MNDRERVKSTDNEKKRIRLLMKSHAKKGKRLGWCIQCQFPWFDGTCDCGNWGEEMDELERLVIENDLAEENA